MLYEFIPKSVYSAFAGLQEFVVSRFACWIPSLEKIHRRQPGGLVVEVTSAIGQNLNMPSIFDSVE